MYMTCSKKNDPFKGLFIVSKIDPPVSSISLANFHPILTKKKVYIFLSFSSIFPDEKKTCTKTLYIPIK